MCGGPTTKAPPPKHTVCLGMSIQITEVFNVSRLADLQCTFLVICLFRASVDLSLLAWDVSHELWLPMEEGQGYIHVLITVSANTGHRIYILFS